jgi:SAM-dependent methyltransferase
MRRVKSGRSRSTAGTTFRSRQLPDAIEIKASTVAVWGASPAGSTHVETGLDGSRDAFDHARLSRSQNELTWIAELIPFDKFRDRDVLEVGCGAGFDAYEFMLKGARYVGIDIVPSNVDLAARHLAYYGLKPKVLVADAEQLPFEDASFDMVFSNGVLHHTPDISRALTEARRVLRPGGSICLSLYHRNSAFYWLTLFVEQHLIRGGFRRHGFRDRVAMIEHTSSGVLPLVNTYSRSEVRRILTACGFETPRMVVRKLRPEDLPTLPVLKALWRLIPQEALDVLERRIGWYVIASARRPAK